MNTPGSPSIGPMDQPLQQRPVLADAVRVLGVLNVTPDSFSDGGLYSSQRDAVAHGLDLWRAGASFVDVGGESTRPGAARIDESTELERVVPVIAELASAGVRCSVDTTRRAVAEAAVGAGAVLINDVSGGLADASMAAFVAQAGVPWVLMHWRAPSAQMSAHAEYRDVVAEVSAELRERVDAALAAGVTEQQIVLDPGIGFAKRPVHNWTLLRHLPALVALGFPVLLGVSRKSFLPSTHEARGTEADLAARDLQTSVLTAYAALAGVWAVRVHDVRSSMRAAEVAAEIGATPGHLDDRPRPADRRARGGSA